MASEPLNSPANSNLPHGASLWFREGFAGDYVEFGDLDDIEVSLTPEFAELFSNRNGLRALRKRILTQRSGTVNFVSLEPSILNIRRADFGGGITSGNSKVFHEQREATLKRDTGDEFYIDMTAVDSSFSIAELQANVVVTKVFLKGDPEQKESMEIANGTGIVDAAGALDININTEVAAGNLVEGATVNVQYEITEADLLKSQIYGADDATIEGDAKLQFRNQSGGVMQLWEFASLQIAPNGAIPFAQDAFQRIPFTGSMQERGGTFGDVYIKATAA